MKVDCLKCGYPWKTILNMICLAALLLPQLLRGDEPKTPPCEIVSEIITIKTFDGLSFDGKLRLPKNQKITKLVINVNSSGPHTYDDRRFLKKNFNYQDLFAEKTVGSGGAYFSYNTRGVTPGDQPPFFCKINKTEYLTYIPANEIRDVEAIIIALNADPRLSGSKVILLGGSAATMVAPQVALRGNVRVDALLLFGYCNTTLDTVLEWQNTGGSSMVNMRAWFDYDGNGAISQEEYKEDRYHIAEAIGGFEAKDSDHDGNLERDDFRALLVERYAALRVAIDTDNDGWFEKNLGLPLTSAWFKDYGNIPPNSETLMALDLPIYIFQGESDANAPVQDTYDIDEAFRKAGKPNLHATIFKNHDHDLNYLKYPLRGEVSPGLNAIFDTISNL